MTGPMLTTTDERRQRWHQAAMLRAQGLSYKAIGRALGVSRTTAATWVNDIRSEWERQAALQRAKDPAVIAEMVRLRRLGKSVREIGRMLNVGYMTVERRTRGVARRSLRPLPDSKAEVERLFRRFEESQTPANYAALMEAVKRYEEAKKSTS